MRPYIGRQRLAAWVSLGVLVLVSGCAHHEEQPTPPAARPKTRPAAPAVTKEVPGSAPAAAPAAAGSSNTLTAEFAALHAAVPPYKVSASLNEITNLRAFKKALPVSPEAQKLLARNLFACAPTDAPQLFHLYEQNDYLNLPSFVTTDLVLQLYHIFYDFTLRSVETKDLSPALERLTRGMLARATTDLKEASDTSLKAAALKNVAYFGVAARLLGVSVDIPSEAAALVNKEMALINAHEGYETGAIFPYRLDYSQFIPRGHYTRTPALKRFFLGMMWYGLAPFSLYTQEGDGKTRRNDEQIRQGLLFVRDLYASKLDAEWDRVYEPTRFYVGAADDLTPAQFKTASDQVYGQNPSLATLADLKQLDRLVDELKKAPAARIQARFGRTEGVEKGTPGMVEPPLPGGLQLRFMGQRYIPDSEILQRLSKPIDRPFPTGLDVMAVLGSSRAITLVDRHSNIYNANHWAAYPDERKKLMDEFAKLPSSDWTSNLYWSWLHSLQALLAPLPEGFPSFMRSDAWQDRSLSTSLASWSELRHDTILYGKQSAAECGGDGDEKPFVKGYVEPNIVFYDRLLALTKQSREGLETRKMLSPELKDRFEKFEDLLNLLHRISQKELHSEKLTEEEYNEIRYIGGKFEYMTLSVMEGNPNLWELVAQADKNMAVVADVHTGADSALEEGVGPANEILVVVPVEGKLVLARGAVFSYYEFKHSSNDRLTDEKWQELLQSGSRPEPPPWTGDFLAPGGTHHLKSSQFEAYNSGC